MNATPMMRHGEAVRPELGPLLSVLFLLIDDKGALVLHVTSAGPREGATTVARDIAAAAAANAAGWGRVALVDAHPIVSRSLGAGRSAQPGLVEYVERGEKPMLRSALLGTSPVDTAPLSTSGRPVAHLEAVRSLYETLRAAYTLIVVDCPPVFVGQQTLLLAPAANETVLVLEAERTKLPDIARARDALEQRGASLLGVVVNKTRRRIPRLLEGWL